MLTSFYFRFADSPQEHTRQCILHVWYMTAAIATYKRNPARPETELFLFFVLCFLAHKFRHPDQWGSHPDPVGVFCSKFDNDVQWQFQSARWNMHTNAITIEFTSLTSILWINRDHLDFAESRSESFGTVFRLRCSQELIESSEPCQLGLPGETILSLLHSNILSCCPQAVHYLLFLFSNCNPNNVRSFGHYTCTSYPRHINTLHKCPCTMAAESLGLMRAFRQLLQWFPPFHCKIRWNRLQMLNNYPQRVLFKQTNPKWAQYN